MKIEKFIENLSDVLDEINSTEHKNSFVSNMKTLNMPDKSFSEWILIYLLWSELGTKDDIDRYYGHLDEESDTVSDK